MKNRGWTSLYTGYCGVQMRQTTWTATYFATLSSFQQYSKAVIPADWVFMQQLAGGFGAGVFGAMFNTPPDVVRSSLQKRVLAQPGEFRGFSLVLCAEGVSAHIKVASEIVAQNGVGGLWSGFGVKALHLGGSGALLAMFIPTFKKMMGVN